MGLVMPNIKSLEKLAKDLKLSHLSFEQLCNNPQVIECVHKKIIECGLENKLNKRELPIKITICPQEWTPDNGLLTAAMKLKRTNIAINYKSIIEKMFSQN